MNLFYIAIGIVDLALSLTASAMLLKTFINTYVHMEELRPGLKKYREKVGITRIGAIGCLRAILLFLAAIVVFMLFPLNILVIIFLYRNDERLISGVCDKFLPTLDESLKMLSEKASAEE